MTNAWSIDDAGNQLGRTAIVTGANAGLGYETALALAGKGAKVILACRSAQKAEEAMQRIQSVYPTAEVEARLLDLGSLTSVRQFSEAFSRDYDSLDLLINNAGIMITPHFTTEDGFEGQLGVNYIGHFVLTGLLLPLLIKTSGARIVSLYSLAANWSGIQFEDIQFQQKYDANKAYSQSKLACLMFGIELNKRLREAGHNTISVAAHPGYSQSDLSRHLSLPLRLMLRIFGSFIMQPTKDGAMPTLYAALSDKLLGGEVIGPGGRKETKGPPTILQSNSNAQDADQRARLWAITEQLCDYKFPV